MRKFLLVGLPGVGKTTTMRAWVQFLNDQGIPANFIPTDVLINQRIRPDDPIIQQYETMHGAISRDIFTSQDPSKTFIDHYGETAMRSLEEALLVNMIESASENDWLDFGGRALLLPKVVEAVKKKGIVIIFLSAKHETIIDRLGKNEEWRFRPTYALAAEKSTDGKGWIANAIKHRQERFEKFTKLAEIIISIDCNKLDSVEHIVREIDLRRSIRK
jgi:shikimate kinase